MLRKSLLALSLLTSSLSLSAADPLSLGIVNFGTCITDSKLGKQEQASFEALKKQMSTLLEDTEKQLNDIAAKFNDPEYLDGLSPEAEEELKTKFRTLNEEMNRYQNQYYQVLNQANMRVIQTISNAVTEASKKVAEKGKISAVLNKDAAFYYQSSLDLTKSVIEEMDKNFDADAKKQDAPKADKKVETPPAPKQSPATGSENSSPSAKK